MAFEAVQNSFYFFAIASHRFQPSHKPTLEIEDSTESMTWEATQLVQASKAMSSLRWLVRWQGIYGF
jgi:hypothetical protein